MKIGAVMDCKGCGQSFIKNEANNFYCSTDCRWKTYYANQRESSAKERGVGECIVCGNMFQRNTTRHFHCSSVCVTRHGLIKREYNTSIDTIKALFNRQNHKCAICQKEFINWFDGNVDHSHDTGEIRGILCINCNFILGHAKDNPDILTKAKEYLLCVLEKTN